MIIQFTRAYYNVQTKFQDQGAYHFVLFFSEIWQAGKSLDSSSSLLLLFLFIYIYILLDNHISRTTQATAMISG